MTVAQRPFHSRSLEQAKLTQSLTHSGCLCFHSQLPKARIDRLTRWFPLCGPFANDPTPNSDHLLISRSKHGCCWETFYMFAYGALVGNPHLTANVFIFCSPFQRQSRKPVAPGHRFHGPGPRGPGASGPRASIERPSAEATPRRTSTWRATYSAAAAQAEIGSELSSGAAWMGAPKKAA